MITIIYENNECIVVNKPSNMPAQKDFSRTPDMLTAVENYLGSKAFLIHRLDRHVAGPVVIGKSKTSAAKLNKQIQGDDFTKIYKAVVIYDNQSVLKPGEIVMLEHYHKKEKSIATIISTQDYMELKDVNKAGFKSVKLKYKCINTLTYDTMSLSVLEIELLTGRFHQIRSQLKYEGLSILGDPKYGITEFNNHTYAKIGLQSTTLKFKDPSNNKFLTFQTEHFDGPFELFQ